MIQYEVQGAVALILMDSAPVNSLGLPLRRLLTEHFKKANSDSAVKAIVLGSSSKIFCGGADISEFGSELTFAEPHLPGLCNAIEASNKLVVAAISGLALGGGCELAMACDYRFAQPSAKLGLPEVNLGIIPGAGGTQRLPRLVGPELALEMISSGKPYPVGELVKAGLIDNICENDNEFIATAVAYAQDLVATSSPSRNCADIAVGADSFSPALFDDFRAKNKRRMHGFYAPERCVQAVEAACTLPLDQGLEKEFSLFKECMDTPQARAQQHLFFAERAVSKIPGVDSNQLHRPIRSVAVIGSGTMGGGIAMNFLNAGIKTFLLDIDQVLLEKGVALIEKNYAISTQKGRFTAAQVERAMHLLTPTTSYDELADVDLVIEAVFEKIEIKQMVFKKLDEVCKSGAILATNTSTLDINQIAAATQRPQDVLGLHFFSPANVMRLLEIVRADNTADDVLITCVALAKRIKKVPVVAQVCWGFIGNRMLEPYGRECARLILEGASPEQIDRVLTDFGFAMGFPSMIDLAGIDVSYMTRQGNREALYSRDPSYALVLDKLYELGHYGQKTGRGFYLYEGRKKAEDPDLMSLAAGLAAEIGIQRRDISDQEILHRTVFMLINEGAQILEEGIAIRSGDIDIAYCNGYGFPSHKGGPMQYADEIGLDTVLTAILELRDQLGDYGAEWFKPAPLLQRLAEQGRCFAG